MRHYDARVDWNIEEMLRLRKEGWSCAALGRKYHKDHTTILYHCKENGIEPAKGFPVPKPVVPRAKKEPVPWNREIESIRSFLRRHKASRSKYAHLLEENINPGKSYQEYVKEALQRPIEAAYTAQIGLEVYQRD